MTDLRTAWRNVAEAWRGVVFAFTPGAIRGWHECNHAAWMAWMDEKVRRGEMMQRRIEWERRQEADLMFHYRARTSAYTLEDLRRSDMMEAMRHPSFLMLEAARQGHLSIDDLVKEIFESNGIKS